MIRTVHHLLVAARALFVFAREGVFSGLDTRPLPPLVRFGLGTLRLIERRHKADAGARLVAALTRLGPSYVKLGQFLATRPDLVGNRIAGSLEALQDRMAPFDQDTARAVIAAAFDRPVEAIYATFDPPLAAASIAQVHRATVKTPSGTRHVAVKVIRPGIARRFRRDIDVYFTIARLAERLVPASRRLRPVGVVETLSRSVTLEMDFRLEAAALSEIAHNTADDPGFRVPGVDWERTARDVLTMDWIEGIPLNDPAGIEAAGLDRRALAAILIQSFLRHAMRDGFFHADMHAGNLFADRAGNVVAIDFGITGRLGPKERRFLAEILYGFITRDYPRIARVHFEAGYVPADQSVEEFARALRSVGEPIHDRTADEISMARLLTQLFEVTELFNMQARTELVMLQKTMVVVEGVARTLDPKLDIWRTAEPVVRTWIERNLGPAGLAERGVQTLYEAAQAVAALPALVTRTEAMLARMEENRDRRHRDNRRPRASRALWIVAGALVAIAVSLYV